MTSLKRSHLWALRWHCASNGPRVLALLGQCQMPCGFFPCVRCSAGILLVSGAALPGCKTESLNSETLSPLTTGTTIIPDTTTTILALYWRAFLAMAAQLGKFFFNTAQRWCSKGPSPQATWTQCTNPTPYMTGETFPAQLSRKLFTHSYESFVGCCGNESVDGKLLVAADNSHMVLYRSHTAHTMATGRDRPFLASV